MFGLAENSWRKSEDALVKLFIEKFKDEGFFIGEKVLGASFYEQVRVEPVKRISDLIVQLEHRLINIEFKLGGYKCLLEQMKDHQRWCDYNYCCVPINWLRVYPKDFSSKILDMKAGLIVYANGTFCEVFKAYHNTYKAGKEKSIRNYVLSQMSKKEPISSSVKDDFLI